MFENVPLMLGLCVVFVVLAWLLVWRMRQISSEREREAEVARQTAEKAFKAATARNAADDARKAEVAARERRATEWREHEAAKAKPEPRVVARVDATRKDRPKHRTEERPAQPVTQTQDDGLLPAIAVGYAAQVLLDPTPEPARAAEVERTSVGPTPAPEPAPATPAPEPSYSPSPTVDSSPTSSSSDF